MSQNFTLRNKKYTVKVGSTLTIEVDVVNADGTARDFTNTGTYNTAKFRVWQPTGTMIINGVASYGSPLTSGKVLYTLTATDTALANVGNWEGDAEMYDSFGSVSDNSETFNFTIEFSP